IPTRGASSSSVTCCACAMVTSACRRVRASALHRTSARWSVIARGHRGTDLYRESSIMNAFENDPRALRIGFIGAGRLGTALAWSFAQRGLRVVAVASMIPADAERLAASIAGCAVVPDGQDVVDRCDLVFVTTPDSAIAEKTTQIRWRAGVAAVHCSGV